MKRRSLYAGLILGAFLVFLKTTAPAIAQKEDGCDFRASVDTLKATRENSLGSLEEVRRELALRKKLLNSILDCAVQDTDSLRAKLNGTAVDTTDAMTIRDKFIGEVSDAIAYYENQRTRINDLGLRGTQDFSKSLYEWRVVHFAPLWKKVENFSIWSNNQKLFQITQNRLNQVNQTVRILKLVDNEEIQDLFQEAKNSFRSAQEENLKARDGFRAETNPDDALVLIKLSLESLAKTYENFFNLSQTVNKILPH